MGLDNSKLFPINFSLFPSRIKADHSVVSFGSDVKDSPTTIVSDSPSINISDCPPQSDLAQSTNETNDNVDNVENDDNNSFVTRKIFLEYLRFKKWFSKK